jgi:signal transduction histidine kinase
MPADLHQIRAEPHAEVGALLQRDAGAIIERWAQRAAQEQPGAKRLHRDALLDHLLNFLRQMGRSLAGADGSANGCHTPLAVEHGEQRWEEGWSLGEVVRDYQILRLVVLEYLEQSLDRPLHGREVMSLGVMLDDSIAASVAAHAWHLQEAARCAEREKAERLRQEEEARHRRQAEDLHEAARRKDEFLALLGHELRNPLAPLQNALHVLRLRGADPPTVAWAQDVAQRQVRLLTRLVDDLLDVSRIGRGKILLRREPLDLAGLVATAVEDYRRSLDGAGLTLVAEVPPAPVWVLGDPVRLAQVVANLLGNAVKFTDPGGRVEVAVAVDEAARQARVSVRDTGVGIEPDLLPRLFELYTQGDRSLQRSRGGLGLGLALVKGLVELHGGGVRASSDGPGRGAHVAFWLPLAARGSAPAETPSGGDQAGRSLRILVVEDNRDAAESLRMLLELARHQVVVAHTGPSGLEAARQFRPDVVLCDLGLPGMDGLAVARALRADPATAGARLVALTGYGSDADHGRAREAGFDLHLVKPVDPKELHRALAPVAAPPA